MFACPQDRTESKFYEVVDVVDVVNIRQGVELDSAIEYTASTGSLLEIEEEVVNSAGHRRARLSDGRGWTSIRSADGFVFLRECMGPFKAGAAVVPGKGKL